MTRIGLSLVIATLLLQAPATRAAQLDKDSCSKLKTEQTQLEQGGTRGSLGKGPDWAKANLAPEKLEQIRRLIEVDEQLLFRCGGRPLVILPSDPDAAPPDVEGKESPKRLPAPTPKAPPGEKKAVPLKKAAAPPVNQPAKAAPKEIPPTTTVPQPGAAPAPAPAKDAAKEAPPSATLPQPEAAPVPAAAKEAAKETLPAKTMPQPEAAPAQPPPTAKEAEDKKAAAVKAAKAKARKKAEDAYHPPAPDWNSNPFANQAAPSAKK